MGGIVDSVGGMLGIGGGGGKEAADVSREAADVQSQAQREALAYLQQQAALPTEMRDKALGMTAGIYGLPGYDMPAGYEGPGRYDPNQSMLLERARTDPLYAAQMASIGDISQRAQEQSMATASATGGLRGGNLQRGFGDIAERQTLAENQALAQAYQQQQNLYNQQYQQDLSQYYNRLSGLQGMAQLPTNANQIAQLQAGIGQTQAQGLLGGYQSGQAAQQAGFGNLAGLAQLGMQAYSTFSDARLKDNITKIGSTPIPGLNKYSWDWKENDLGLSGSDTGYIAQEVENVWPELVEEHESGYKQIKIAEINKRLGEL